MYMLQGDAVTSELEARLGALQGDLHAVRETAARQTADVAGLMEELSTAQAMMQAQVRASCRLPYTIVYYSIPVCYYSSIYYYTRLDCTILDYTIL